MKTKFYMNYVFRWYVIIISITYIGGYLFTLYGLSISNLPQNTRALVIIIALVPLIILSIIILIFKNQFCSKLIIREEGIEICSFKKRSLIILWNDIENIKSYFSFSLHKYVRIKCRERLIDFNVNTKIMNTLLFYIKNDELNQQLRKIQTHRFRIATRGIGFDK